MSPSDITISPVTLPLVLPLEEVMEKGFSLLHTALTDESFISSLRALSNEAAVVELVYL